MAKLRGMATFGERVRAPRLKAGLKGKDLAARLSVKPSQVSNWENDRYKSVELETAGRIARALDVKLHELLDGVHMGGGFTSGEASKMSWLLQGIKSELLPRIGQELEQGSITPAEAEAVTSELIKKLTDVERRVREKAGSVVTSDVTPSSQTQPGRETKTKVEGEEELVAESWGWIEAELARVPEALRGRAREKAHVAVLRAVRSFERGAASGQRAAQNRARKAR